MNRYKKWESDHGVKFPTERMTSLEFMDWVKANRPQYPRMSNEEWIKMVNDCEDKVDFLKGFEEFESRINELKKDKPSSD